MTQIRIVDEQAELPLATDWGSWANRFEALLDQLRSVREGALEDERQVYMKRQRIENLQSRIRALVVGFRALEEEVQDYLERD